MKPAIESFFDVPTQIAKTSAGPVEMPIRYYDSTVVTAFYRVDYARAQPMLAPKGLTALKLPGGKAGLAISWCEYRSTTIGPYNELAVSLLAYYGDQPPSWPLLTMLRGADSNLGVHILHLPVTTSIAWAAGCEFWGFPKTVDEIPYRWKKGWLDASLISGGQRIFSMGIPLHRGLRAPMMDLVTLSVQNGAIIKTRTPTRATGILSRGGSTTLEIHQPDHPIGATLKALGIDRAPDGIMTANPMPAVLPFGQEVARVS